MLICSFLLPYNGAKRKTSGEETETTYQSVKPILLMTSLDRITLDSDEWADTRQVVSTIYLCKLTFFFFSQVFGEFVFVSWVWKFKATEMRWLCVFSSQQASCCIPETCTVGEVASSDCPLGRKVARLPRWRLDLIHSSSIHQFIHFYSFAFLWLALNCSLFNYVSSGLIEGVTWGRMGGGGQVVDYQLTAERFMHCLCLERKK